MWPICLTREEDFVMVNEVQGDFAGGEVTLPILVIVPVDRIVNVHVELNKVKQSFDYAGAHGSFDETLTTVSGRPNENEALTSKLSHSKRDLKGRLVVASR